jgi:hypothetical protein
MAKPPNPPPPPSADGVNKLYHQLVEIHAIAAAQLQSIPIGAGLAQPLTWLTPGPVGGGLLSSPPRQGWFHHHRMVSLPNIARATGPMRRTPSSLMGLPEGRAAQTPHAESTL